MSTDKTQLQSPIGSLHNVDACQQETRRWYQSAAGKNATLGVQQAVEEMSSEVFGYYALQVGDLAQQYTLLQDSRISSCFNVAPTLPVDVEVDFIAEAIALPVEFDNIDLVVASHVLDCTAYPHQVLREIERVLVPEGHCILIAYNPFSWRGMSLSWRKLRKQPVPVAYTAFRLHDWFSVLGFEVVATRTVGFRPRRHKNAMLRRIALLDKLVGHYRRLFGNVQLIQVRKKVAGRIAMKPKLRAKPLLKPGMAVNSGGVGKTIKQIKRMEQRENGE